LVKSGYSGKRLFLCDCRPYSILGVRPMKRPPYRPKPGPRVRAIGLVVAVLLTYDGPAGRGHAEPPACPPAGGGPSPPAFLPLPGETAQNPACPPANAGFSALLPRTPDRPPLPATWPGSVAAFVEGVNRSESAFEVLVGHGRVLTTKVDLG